MHQNQPASSTIKLITIGSGIFFTLIAYVVIAVVQHQPFSSIFLGGQPLLTQLGIGILTGIVSVLLLIYVPAFSDVRRFAHQMIGQQLNPSKTEIPLIAIATGVGEELLYRAVIQPFVGIWVTSLLFALSHVGIDLKKPYMIAFNMFLFVMSMAMGALYIWVGLVAAIAAHITYNIGIMSYIHSKKA